MSQKYTFIATYASQYPVTVICRVLGVRRSGYYAWRARPPTARAQRDTLLRREIDGAFQASRRTYGSPRVHAELKARGVRCSQKRVARLMREANLVARPRRRRVRTTDSGHTLPVAENIVARKFVATAPNRLWVADITYLPTREGWLYLAVILDLFARRVVGWSMQPTLERRLVLAALDHALQQRRPGTPLVHHSDRGSQYASGDYQDQLAAAGIQCSMSRRGNCWDNAPMESFFSTLKAELGETVYPSHAAARSAVFAYIEGFYNRERRHSALGYKSPMAFEQLYQRQPAAA